MRRPDRTFDPFSESPVDGVIAAHCSVQVSVVFINCFCIHGDYIICSVNDDKNVTIIIIYCKHPHVIHTHT